MNRYQWVISTIAILAAGSLAVGCTPGGVGDPCIPEDEYEAGFSGYGLEEVNVEAMSFQCETRLCLVNHFRGRVSCPYGQQFPPNADGSVGNVNNIADPNMRCKVPDGKSSLVTVEVQPQLVKRRANNSVYCSCRCSGPDKTARYCKCPSGYGCTLLNDIPLGSGSSQLLGSYCVRNGTAYSKGSDSNSQACAVTSPQDPNTLCGYEGYGDKVNPY